VAQPGEQRQMRFERVIADVHFAILNLKGMPKPVVAAVQGAVAGFGMSLMMACDLVVAAEDAYFTLAYSNIALSPDGGATWSLPRQVGLKQAMEIALLGERFDAARARRRHWRWRSGWRADRPAPWHAPKRCSTSRWPHRWQHSCRPSSRLLPPVPPKRTLAKDWPPSLNVGRPPTPFRSGRWC
jgi:hypothetical protein